MRVSGSVIQVRAGCLELGVVHTAHANPQSVCSADPAHWAGPWYTLSPGLVRRAARRSDVHIMFIVRIGLGSTRREASASYIERTGTRTGSTARRSARPPRSYRVRYRRLESWTSSQERRRLCQGPDTAEGRRGQKVGVGILSVSDRKHGIRMIDGLSIPHANPQPLTPTLRLAGPPT